MTLLMYAMLFVMRSSTDLAVIPRARPIPASNTSWRECLVIATVYSSLTRRREAGSTLASLSGLRPVQKWEMRRSPVPAFANGSADSPHRPLDEEGALVLYVLGKTGHAVRLDNRSSERPGRVVIPFRTYRRRVQRGQQSSNA